MEKLISRKEAAKLLGISIATLDCSSKQWANFLCSVCAKWLRVLYDAGLQESIAKCTHRAKPVEKSATYRKLREVSELELFRILAGT